MSSVKEVYIFLFQGVRIYSVQALNNSTSTVFYETMASLTGGIHLKLDQFSNIFDLIMAICYREGGVDLLQVRVYA